MFFDSSNVDIYESEDITDTDRNEFSFGEVNDPNHIDLVNIDFEAAKERFKGRTLNVKEVDFSDSIAHKRRQAYGSTAYTLEVIGGASSKLETPEQKFNRLTYEINELSELVKNETDDAGSLLTPANCSLLLDELNDLKVVKGGSSASAVCQTENASSVQNTAVTPSSALVFFENRLRRIEAVVGPFPSNSHSLVDSLEDLKFRMEALNPVYLEGCETRLNTILATLDKVESKGDRRGDASSQKKVDKLLKIINKWDTICDSLPSNVKKLQTLHKLHEQSQHFSDRLSQVVGIRNQVDKAISRDKDDIRDLQLQTKQDVAAIGKQIAALEKRLESLGK